MANLPKGYLEMSREDYATLDVETARVVFAELREIVRYTMGRDDADSAIRCAFPCNAEESPVEWIMSVMRVTCKCARCRGSGTYYWGACINGRMTHSAPCARCGGNGVMTFDDMRRGRAYDNYAICRAAGF
jgi:hypothetical protein